MYVPCHHSSITSSRFTRSVAMEVFLSQSCNCATCLQVRAQKSVGASSSGWDCSSVLESCNCQSCSLDVPPASELSSFSGAFLESCSCSSCRVPAPLPSSAMVSSGPRGEAAFWIDAHEKVKASGVFNFQQCRIPVRSSLNIPCWRSWFRSSGCSDTSLLGFLEFGWPLGFTGANLPIGGTKNHQGAEVFETETVQYLDKEIDAGAIIGPFPNNPLSSDLVFSPINSIPKKGSDARRFISDLSFPSGASVNDGINLDSYLGASCKFTYPTVDDFVCLIKSQGVGALMYKKDLIRAFRQFFLDPGDVRFQAFRWRGQVFLDCALVMGCRSSAMMCQRATSAVSFFMESEGAHVCAYLDDFAGCAVPGRARSDYLLLGALLRDLGLGEAKKKSCEPSTKMEFLGILFNSITMTLQVTPNRLVEIRELLSVWLTKRSASKKEIQSLVGKLQFTAKCVPAGRLFISRILDSLKGLTSPSHRRKISSQFRKDLEWWSRFLTSFNGVSMMLEVEWLRPDSVFATDACLDGGGGWVLGEYFRFSFPVELSVRSLHINCLELLVLVVALKLWAPGLVGKRIKVFCDNTATVTVLNSGKCKDADMLSLLREVSFVCAVNSCLVRAVHLPGTQNRLADDLSRWSSLGAPARCLVEKQLSTWRRRTVSKELLRTVCDW